ncbi:MAG TPA: DUF1707 domain-containing protein [Actinopolymorphaceae bacterium]
MSEQVPERASQRASDADREAVVSMLQEAASDGRLDLEEFEERMAATYRSKTLGELDTLTRDLRGGSGGAVVPGRTTELRLASVGSTIKRSGAWVVPRKVIVDGKFGSTRLDLTRAKITSRDVEIALDTAAGSVQIIVPDDTAVDADDLVTNFGSVSVRVHGPDNPSLRLKITGRTNMGSVVVRRLSFIERWWRRLRKR